MIKKLALIAVSAVSLFNLLAVTPVAHAAQDCNGVSSTNPLGILKFPTWYQYLDDSQFGPDCSIKEFDVAKDTWKVALAILEMLLRVAGLVAFGYVIWGGFKFTMSQGKSEEAAKARQTIIDAIIGVVIASIATVVVSYLARVMIVGS